MPWRAAQPEELSAPTLRYVRRYSQSVPIETLEITPRGDANLARNLTYFPTNTPISDESELRAIIMECNVDLLILNVLCNMSPCQIETGEAGKRHFAAVCKSTNEPNTLPCPVFCP
uniref:Uncharacterized protein n=1 Tax=mine drainage metagenome TaxID=410659 RepID=E6PY12_9ZZZZ